MFNKSAGGSVDEKRVFIDDEAFESNKPRNKPPEPAPQSARAQTYTYKQFLEGMLVDPSNARSSQSREREDLKQMVLPSSIA